MWYTPMAECFIAHLYGGALLAAGVGVLRDCPEADLLFFLFRLFLWHLFKSTTTQRRSRRSMDTVSEFHAEAPQATVSEGLAA